jgi:hypothetical protein
MHQCPASLLERYRPGNSADAARPTGTAGSHLTRWRWIES